MSSTLLRVKPETLRNQVESALREAVISGQFAPGARLVERDLCEMLGVSRTSVREALRKLEAEKLVTIVPHKGPIVTAISQAEAADLFALRSVLECFVVEQFTQLATDAAVEALGEAIRRLRDEASRQNTAGVIEAKTCLYDVLLSHCGNLLLQETLNGLMSRISLLRATSLMRPDRLQSSVNEMDVLYGFVKKRDSAAAGQAARAHVANAQQAAMRELERIALQD